MADKKFNLIKFQTHALYQRLIPPSQKYTPGNLTKLPDKHFQC